MPRAIELDADARAVGDQREHDDGKADQEQRDAEGDQKRRREHGPDRVVVAAEQHFDDARADLRRPDQHAERHGGREAEAARLQHGEEMHRHHRGDDGAERDGCGHQDERDEVSARDQRPDACRLVAIAG